MGLALAACLGACGHERPRDLPPEPAEPPVRAASGARLDFIQFRNEPRPREGAPFDPFGVPPPPATPPLESPSNLPIPERPSTPSYL